MTFEIFLLAFTGGMAGGAVGFCIGELIVRGVLWIVKNR